MQKKIIPLLILILATAATAQVPTYTLDCILPAPDCRSVDMSPDGTKICANFDVAPLGGGRGYRIFDAYTYLPIRDCSLSGVPWTGLFSSDSDYVWTTIYYGGYLKKIDYTDCSVAHSSDLGSWTEGLAFGSQRRYLYVGENNPGGYAIGTLQKFDTDTNSVDWSVTLNGEPGRCIVVGPDDQFVYQVTHNAGTEMLYKIRTSDGNVEYTRDVNGVLLPGISVSPDGGTVYVPYADANLVYVIETATLTILDTWPIDSPDGFFVSPDGTHAIVIDRNSPDIRVFDLLSESVVQTIDVGNVGTYSFCSKTPYWDTSRGKVYLNLSASEGGVAVLSISEPAAGLIAYWSFDDSGDPGHDDSGNDHDGTVNGAVSTDGICGKALSFDGLNDYVEVPDDDALDPTSTQEITITAWVKISTYQAKTSSLLFGIVGKISSPTRPVGSYAFGIRNDHDHNPTHVVGKLDFMVCYDGLHLQDVYSNSLVPKNRWVHVAFTHDINQNSKFFIDGQLDAINSSTITTDFANNNIPLRIGHTNSFWDYFYGSIDEVRIYDRALSESEIGELAAECPPEPDIEVSPLIYDFGNVEIGLSETMIVTISNVGNGDLNVSGIALETDFAITSAPAAAIVVEPNKTVDVEITYTPTVLGHNSAVLKITSNDPDEPVVEVQLSAVAIEIPVPPSEQIANILAFFDTSVDGGSLVGDGPGNSAEKRLNALRNMVEAAGSLIDDELSEEACQQLLDVYRRMDGQPSPPDFVKGEAVPELATMIQELMTTLGCE